MSQLVSLNVSIGPDLAGFVMDDLDGRDYTVTLCRKQGLAYYEVPLPTILMALAQQATGAFLDVGANTGPYSLLAAAASPHLEVYAFEPVPAVARQLAHNISLNPTLARRIHLVEAALSDQTSTGTIYEHVNNRGLLPTGSTIEEGVHDASDSTRVEIGLITLDEWVAVASQSATRARPLRIDCMKIDVEGHERHTILGAEQTIAHHRPIIVIELIKADYGFFEAFLKRHDYVDIALYPGAANGLCHRRPLPIPSN